MMVFKAYKDILFLIVFLLIAALVLLPGHAMAAETQGGPSKPASQRPEPVVMVKVGDSDITVEHFVEYLQRHPELLPNSITPAGKKAIVRDMVKEHLVEKYMLKEGLIQAPLREKPLPAHELGQAFSKLRSKYFPPALPPTEEEAKRFYEEHKDLFAIPASIRISQIQIRVPEGTDEGTRVKAEKRAHEALNKIRGGASFETVAAEYTEHPHGKFTNGDLGFVPARTGDVFFDTHVATLGLGETSGVLKSPVGYEIYRVTEHGEAIYTPYENTRSVSSKYMQYVNEESKKAFFRMAAKEIGITAMLPELAGTGNF